MRVDVLVPQIGEAVAELMLTQWLKHPGDQVKQGDVLFEIDSDKAIVEVEAYADGILVEVVQGDGAAVMPLQVVAYIETEAVAVSEPPASPPAPSALATPESNGYKVSPVAERMAADLAVDLRAVSGTGTGGRITVEDVRRHADRASAVRPTLARVFASPKARLLVAEQGIDLTLIEGSGVQGMIITRDLARAATTATDIAPTLPASAPKAQPLSRTRATIARRMVESKQQVPHFYLMAEVNVTRADELRRYCLEVLHWDKAPTYTDILVRACAQALVEMPQVNRSFVDDAYITHDTVHIGVAVSTDDGLVVPVIANADGLSLRQTSQALREVASRARAGRLRPTDMGAKSMAISNLGMYGVDAFVAIIDMPDPMILAVGRVAERVVPINGQVTIQRMCTLTLSVDHRVLDGALAAQFLERISAHLEQPFAILGHS
jgi:pyruvate dehydrogenase E2 component (dihydrolipoamide acetyltransferase)